MVFRIFVNNGFLIKRHSTTVSEDYIFPMKVKIEK